MLRPGGRIPPARVNVIGVLPDAVIWLMYAEPAFPDGRVDVEVMDMGGQRGLGGLVTVIENGFAVVWGALGQLSVARTVKL